MHKRRRSSGNSRQEPSSDDSEPEPSPMPVARKKKKLDPSELCQQLYDSIRNFKKEDGTMLCDTFVRVPKRRQEPSYYDVVANPIDLLKVQQKLKTEAYDDIEELTTDFELLVNNAKAFYKPDSVEYQDACTLWEMFTTKAKQLESGADLTADTRRPVRARKSVTMDEPTSDPLEVDNELLEELFGSVMQARDPINEDRYLHSQFQLLPSKKLYPDYYDVIEHPIDLKLIATKIQTSAYTSLTDMEKDLLQMVKNACTFNEPGSQIYKDAKSLKKIFTAKKADIENGRVRRTQARKEKGFSAKIAALKEEVESSDDEADDLMEAEGNGPIWQLFDQLYNTANLAGAPLGDSLWKLPNRRFHPEYYSVVKKPISMAQIRNKLKKGVYSVITDMTADLYLMLDNAKKAIPPHKQTYKDAVKMQKILNQKLIDNGLDLEDTESEDTTDSTSLQQLNSSTQSSITSTPHNASNMTNLSSPSPAMTSFSGMITTEKKKKGRPRLGTTPTTSGIAKVRVTNHALALKKKLLALHRYFLDYTVDNRRPMDLFLEKPSKKLYPDYYKVIHQPIDMQTIEAQIKGDHYATMEEVFSDYRLMFMNCRNYNEEGSVIYEDANILERALNEKIKEFAGMDPRLNKKGAKTARKSLINNPNQNTIEPKLRIIYDAIRDYREPKTGRQLALIFMKLPSKNDYPDYYDIIKQPIDMEKISMKLNKHQYETVEEIAADFMLMFENACKYNEPDSQIYKDSLLLQQLCIQTKQSLRDTDESVPDVTQAVQELLLSLFTTLYNYQDEESRCYSDSLAELPEHDEVDNVKVRGISLDLIKRRLDKGLYKRLDTFQEDIFSCLERARKLSRTDSQVFEDSIEMQSFFIRKRDELCKNGEALSSPALSYTVMHLRASVEATRQSKLLQEGGDQETDDTAISQSGESMMIDEKVYSPGDFVYYDLPDNKVPGILCIERLWSTPENVKMMSGVIFSRPYETYHLQTRKFMEQEVFRSDQRATEPLEKIRGRCHVMHVKDYFKMKPEGFADQDVFVCESKYARRMFKKLKNWSSTVPLVARETPLEVKRVQSVFKERVEKHKVELSELSLQEALVEKEKPNVVVCTNGSDDGNTYFEQYNTICSGVVKLGDFVYVATESGKQSIAQIQSLWETKDGKCFFRGPWLLTPPEVPGTISKLFYRQEVMLSTTCETSPTVAIVGRCAVLDYCDYITRRPTEIAEADVYLCEATYDELKKEIKKTFGATVHLRSFVHSQMVTADEIYFFKRPIMPPKVSCGEIVAQQEKTSLQDLNNLRLESLDSDCIVDDTSVDSAYIGSDTQTVMGTSIHSKQPPIQIKLTTGFSLFATEHCQSHTKQSPGTDVHLEWPRLAVGARNKYEERATTMNNDSLNVIGKKDYKSESMDLLGIAEDSLDSHVGSDHLQTSASPAPSSQTPGPIKGRRPKVITGYILYASARRKNVSVCNPDARFGEISRIIGNEWRSMEQTERQVYEDRASKINGANAEKHHLEFPNGVGAYEAPSILQREILPNQVFECCWSKCDYQFEDPADCLEHCVGDKNSCVAKHFLGQADPVYHCYWRGCIRIKRSSPAFPHVKRLIKHVTEVHVNKSTGRIIAPERQKSKNYHPRKEKPVVVEPVVIQKTPPSIIQSVQHGGHQTVAVMQQQQQQPKMMSPVMNPASILNVVQAPPAEPLFVTVPPRPQRVLHSEAYIKYIEGLQSNNHNISAYERTLKATPETVQTDASRLPTQWLGNRAKDEDVVGALWDLRNYMLKDILQLHRF